MLVYRKVPLLLSCEFNLPDIDWEANALKENPSNQRECMPFLETVLELGLNQCIDFPTREANILVLIFSNNVVPCPSVSDHDMIIYNFHGRADKSITRTKEVYLYHKAEVVDFRTYLQIILKSIKFSLLKF